jgi:hypothetical protein
MSNINTLENQIPANFSDSSMTFIVNRMKESIDSLYHTSKEKYSLKSKLIEEADDMTTNEKLVALDQNYDCHTQEVWQNIIIFGTVSIALIGIATGSPTIIKSIRSLAA